MGAGRRTQTLLADSASEPRVAAHRGLKPQDLGAVIFVCNNETAEECISRSLFGLPRSHLTYVRNIDEGLPLFLFNYDDRALLGTFAAASPGGYNLEPYAWSSDGTSQTRFPAQVRVRLDRDCLPVPEKIFSRVMRENYYAPGRFLLELTKKQTQDILRLFTPKPVVVPVITPSVAPPVNTVVKAKVVKGKPVLLGSAWKKVEKPSEAPTADSEFPPLNAKGKAAEEQPAVEEAGAEGEKPGKPWFEAAVEQVIKEVTEPVAEEVTAAGKSWFEQTEEEMLEKILENLQVNEGGSSSSGGKMFTVFNEKAETEVEREKLVKAMHESGLTSVVEKNLRLCSEALEEMQVSELRLGQTMEELRVKGEVLKDVNKMREKNKVMVKTSIGMLHEIKRLKSDINELKVQLVKAQ